MNLSTVKRRPTLLIGLAFTIFTLGVLWVWSHLKEMRPPLPVYGPVGDFGLTNHLGAPVSLQNLRGQVWVADVIFSRCPTECLKMTKRMSELQAALPSDTRVKLLSVTIDPEFDTPDVLKSYAEKFGAKPDRWWFLTGPKDQVRQVLANRLRLSAVETPPELRTNRFDLFTHSTLFLVVDKHAQLRASVESLAPDWQEKILGDINQLLRED